jgi:hypothetical protein
VQHKVIAGCVYRRDGNSRGVNQDVVGKKVREDDEPSWALRTQPTGACSGRRFHEDLAALDPKLGRERGPPLGLAGNLQTSHPLGIFSKAQDFDSRSGFTAAGHEDQAQQGNGTFWSLGVHFNSRALMAYRSGNPAVADDSIALKG